MGRTERGHTEAGGRGTAEEEVGEGTGGSPGPRGRRGRSSRARQSRGRRPAWQGLPPDTDTPPAWSHGARPTPPAPSGPAAGCAALCPQGREVLVGQGGHLCLAASSGAPGLSERGRLRGMEPTSFHPTRTENCPSGLLRPHRGALMQGSGRSEPSPPEPIPTKKHRAETTGEPSADTFLVSLLRASDNPCSPAQ